MKAYDQSTTIVFPAKAFLQTLTRLLNYTPPLQLSRKTRFDKMKDLAHMMLQVLSATDAVPTEYVKRYGAEYQIARTC